MGVSGIAVGGAVEAGEENGEGMFQHGETGADDAYIGLNKRPSGAWDEGPWWKHQSIRSRGKDKVFLIGVLTG